MNKKARTRKGKGLIDGIANMVLSNKHNKLMQANDTR